MREAGGGVRGAWELVVGAAAESPADRKLPAARRLARRGRDTPPEVIVEARGGREPVPRLEASCIQFAGHSRRVVLRLHQRDAWRETRDQATRWPISC